MAYSIECVLECGNHLGESPIWDAEEGRLYWVDGTGRRVGNPALWRLDPRTGKAENWRLDRKLDEIYVTSMARVKHPAVHEHFAKQAKPQFAAGALFRIKGLGIKGLPEPRFAG